MSRKKSEQRPYRFMTKNDSTTSPSKLYPYTDKPLAAYPFISIFEFYGTDPIEKIEGPLIFEFSNHYAPDKSLAECAQLLKILKQYQIDIKKVIYHSGAVGYHRITVKKDLFLKGPGDLTAIFQPLVYHTILQHYDFSHFEHLNRNLYLNGIYSLISRIGNDPECDGASATEYLNGYLLTADCGQHFTSPRNPSGPKTFYQALYRPALLDILTRLPFDQLIIPPDVADPLLHLTESCPVIKNLFGPHPRRDAKQLHLLAYVCHALKDCGEQLLCMWLEAYASYKRTYFFEIIKKLQTEYPKLRTCTAIREKGLCRKKHPCGVISPLDLVHAPQNNCTPTPLPPADECAARIETWLHKQRRQYVYFRDINRSFYKTYEAPAVAKAIKLLVQHKYLVEVIPEYRRLSGTRPGSLFIITQNVPQANKTTEPSPVPPSGNTPSETPLPSSAENTANEISPPAITPPLTPNEAAISQTKSCIGGADF